MTTNVYQELIEANRHHREDALDELNEFAKALIDIGSVVSIKFRNDNRYWVLPIESITLKLQTENLEKIQLHDAGSDECRTWMWLEYRSGTYRLGDYRGTMREVLSKYITDRPDIFQ